MYDVKDLTAGTLCMPTEKLSIEAQDRSKFFGVGGHNLRKLRSETGMFLFGRGKAWLDMQESEHLDRWTMKISRIGIPQVI